MITIIIASSNEKDSIGKAIKSIADSEYSGYNGSFELIQVSPDNETLSAGQLAAEKLNLDEKYFQIKDPKKGKSTALNMALNIAQGDIIVMTDGDVFFNNMALKELLACFNDEKIGGVSGQPISQNDQSDFWGYISHLLTAAADTKRKEIFNTKVGNYYMHKGGYFPVSGYILAFRNIGLKYDSAYIDDALISLEILKNGYQLAYTPKAQVFVRFPNNIKDYLLQRRRNLSGNKEIHKDYRFEDQNDPRSFINEIKFLTFPIRYASNTREFFWSLILYPLRLLTWIIVALPRKKE